MNTKEQTKINVIVEPWSWSVKIYTDGYKSEPVLRSSFEYRLAHATYSNLIISYSSIDIPEEVIEFIQSSFSRLSDILLRTQQKQVCFDFTIQGDDINLEIISDRNVENCFRIKHTYERGRLIGSKNCLLSSVETSLTLKTKEPVPDAILDVFATDLVDKALLSISEAEEEDYTHSNVKLRAISA